MQLHVTYSDATTGYIDLGDVFAIIEKEKNEEKFTDIANKVLSGGEPKCYAFIVHHQGSKTQPLYESFSYTLYSDNGDPFKDISLR